MIKVEDLWESVKALLWSWVWAPNLSHLPPIQAGAVRFARVIHMVTRELVAGRLRLRAASLVYTTMLSLVPVLAVSFSLLKAFGVHYRFEDVLLELLQPMGPNGAEVAGRILGFVDNVDVTYLGSLGLAFLVYTVLSSVHQVEESLNEAWRVKEPRGWTERFSGYLSVILVGPVLVFAAMYVTASVTSSQAFQQFVVLAPFGAALNFGSKLFTYALIVGAFTFVYIYIPNTTVRFKSALFGALVAGLLWALAGWLFAGFVVDATRTSAIYSSFAILVFFLMWLFLAWLIVLVGGSVAFYHQHPEYRGLLAHELEMSNRIRERLAWQSTFLIAQHFRHALPPLTVLALAQRLHVPVEALEQVLKALVKEAILVQTGADSPAYLPARELSAIKLAQILEATRAAGETRQLDYDSVVMESEVSELAQAIEAHSSRTLAHRSLADLVSQLPATTEEPPEEPLGEETPTEDVLEAQGPSADRLSTTLDFAAVPIDRAKRSTESE